jgi:hypothetical protein
MKFINTLFLINLVTCVPCLASAQTVEDGANNITWSMEPRWGSGDILGVTAYNSSGSPYTEGIATGIINTDANSIISSIEINKNAYGVVRLNNDLTTQWLTPIDGYPIATGIFHDDVLVITTGDITLRKGTSNSYTGNLIDKKTGKLILKKNFYTSSDDFYEQHVFLISSDGAYFKLAVRLSTLTKKVHFGLGFSQNKSADAFFDGNDFKILEYDSNLDLKSTTKPVLEKGAFTGATINKNGDVFLMTDYGGGLIKIACYENEKTTPVKVLQVPVSMGDKEIDDLTDQYLFTSKTDPSIIFYTVMYPNAEKDKELVVAKLNFKDGTVLKNTQIMDKPYLKDLAKSFVPFSKKFDDVELGERNEMHINNVLENDGRLILCVSSHTEVSANSGTGSIPSTSGSITGRDLIINIYDNKTNLQYQQIIPRKYFSNNIGYINMGVSLHCDNTKLYIAANNNKGALLAKIDLKAGAITGIDIINKKDIKHSDGFNPSATIWFNNKLIISYIQEKGWVYSRSDDAHLQLVDF